MLIRKRTGGLGRLLRQPRDPSEDTALPGRQAGALRCWPARPGPHFRSIWSCFHLRRCVEAYRTFEMTSSPQLASGSHRQHLSVPAPL